MYMDMDNYDVIRRVYYNYDMNMQHDWKLFKQRKLLKRFKQLIMQGKIQERTNINPTIPTSGRRRHRKIKKVYKNLCFYVLNINFA